MSLRLVPAVPAALLAAVLAPTAAAGDLPATDTALYRVTFDAHWSAATHPTTFPPNPHFSGLIGGTHHAGVSFWSPGTLASPGIEQMAELGGKTALIAEVDDALSAGTAEALISGGGVALSPGSVSRQFAVSQSHPLVTLTSMIAPSPDWFVGVHDLSLLVDGDWIDELVVPLDAYDAGTDSGTGFTSGNADTNPAEPIALITGFPFASGVPLGSFTFTRLDAPSPWVDLGAGLAGVAGVPGLSGSGDLSAGETVGLEAVAAAPDAAAVFVFGLSELGAPFKGGTLVPSPDLLLPGFSTASDGGLSVAAVWPASAPAGLSLVIQLWVVDGAAPQGFSATNGLCRTTE